jgi:tetratricopeptide (TPR) repeat protein
LRGSARGGLPLVDARTCWIALALGLLVFACFSHALTHREFGLVDDPELVTENAMIARGLGVRGLVWAFGVHGEGSAGANWIPLTWISHMLDVSLFGFDAGAHKAVNVALHAAATALLCVALQALTGQLWPSALAAALFGIHPLRAESVAWVSERKDVLSALFWMATLLAYAHYTRAPSRRRYAGLFVIFALGLAAKSMLMTLPVILLLLDHWPLERHRRTSRAVLVREKIPLLVLSAAVGAVTIAAQVGARAVAAGERFAAAQRVANALRSATDYLAAFFVPLDLSHYYPHRYPTLAHLDTLGEWMPALASLAILAAVGLAAFAVRRRFPALAVGWLWYLVALAPVIGVIQIGHQAMADRYTYLPSIGVAIALAFPLWQLAATTRGGRSAYAIAGGVLVLGCFAPWTFRTVRLWATNEGLYRHSLQAIDARGLPHDGFMQRMLAVAHLVALQRDPGAVDAARRAEALRAAEAALRIRPDDPAAHSTNTDLLIALGRYPDAVEAAAAFAASAQRAGRPDLVALAHYASGVAFSRMQRYADARAAFERALVVAPDFGLAAEALAWARDAGSRAEAPVSPPR